MRYQGWIVLLAGLLAAPGGLFAAAGWGAPEPYSPMNGSRAQAAGYASDYSYSRARPRYRDLAPVMQARGYRFRPMEAQAYPAPKQQRPVGLQPRVVHGRMPGWRPAGSRDRSMPQARPVGTYSPAGYRFRPMQGTREAVNKRPLRYRPLEVRIPENAVFRPLNPVARRVQQRDRHYPRPSFRAAYPPLTTGLPANPYSSGLPWQHAPFRAMPPAASYRYAAVPRQALSQHRFYPPYYFPRRNQAMNRMPRFRPWSRPELSRQAVATHNRRYARYSQPGPYQKPYPAYTRPYDRRRTMPPLGSAANNRKMALYPPLPPAKLNRYGTDWYDGRGDGDGAWYRLTVGSVPTLTQAASPNASLAGD